MNKLAITTAFAVSCFVLTATNIEAQTKSNFRPNLSKHPIQGMQVGTGKGATTAGQTQMNGMNKLNPASMMNPYGMNPNGMNPYGQSPYGMNPYGQGANPYGMMNPYGMNPYGNPYGMNPYGMNQNSFFRGF